MFSQFSQLFLQLCILDFQRSFSPREEAFVPDMCIDLIGEMTCMHKRFTARRLHWTSQWKQTEMLSGLYFWINKQIPSNVSATIDARNISRRLTVVNLLFTNLAIVDSFLRNMWVRIDFSCSLHTKLIQLSCLLNHLYCLKHCPSWAEQKTYPTEIETSFENWSMFQQALKFLITSFQCDSLF